ncbi:hypothetical protein MANES_08G004120v8 [Manihot esculenta]|uniref:Uncharacterized protein n=2 Tax=Manihot esculenta TaxID=3983 RepID=A0ACB7H7E3_MANES|nr:hypothetical protein MANES_08G004114v8 [Manihot esculenta]KAG8648520.1 hypothetical protein MANES_08G004120v8 [Manihot esculenta]
MKIYTKPISSPGRTENYPPPLMRFLRSNVSSRSRGRSRSSPMFVRKKNGATETQEPSSPKDTCIGQVRVKRSKQAKTQPSKIKCFCKWVRNTPFCQHLNRATRRPKCTLLSWRKWIMFFKVGVRRESKIREDSSKVEPKFGNISEDAGQESEVEDEENKMYVSSSISPPKNALLLTRSRSAPCRSSSVACRFWGSPLESEETEQN